MSDSEKSSSVARLYARSSAGGTRRFVTAIDLAGAPLPIKPGYVVIFRHDDIVYADSVEIEFGNRDVEPSA